MSACTGHRQPATQRYLPYPQRRGHSRVLCDCSSRRTSRSPRQTGAGPVARRPRRQPSSVTHCRSLRRIRHQPDPRHVRQLSFVSQPHRPGRRTPRQRALRIKPRASGEDREYIQRLEIGALRRRTRRRRAGHRSRMVGSIARPSAHPRRRIVSCLRPRCEPRSPHCRRITGFTGDAADRRARQRSRREPGRR